MSRIIQLSEASSIVLHTMILLAGEFEETKSAREIAEVLNISEAHLAKVIQQLARAGLVLTARGPKGGVRLAREPDDITFLEIYETIDGKLAGEHCLLHTEGGCPFRDCIFGDVLDRMSAEIREKFANTTLETHRRDIKEKGRSIQ